jgi:hypothetical protein
MLRAAQAITGREKQGQSLPAASDAEGTTLVAIKACERHYGAGRNLTKAKKTQP